MYITGPSWAYELSVRFASCTLVRPAMHNGQKVDLMAPPAELGQPLAVVAKALLPHLQNDPKMALIEVAIPDGNKPICCRDILTGVRTEENGKLAAHSNHAVYCIGWWLGKERLYLEIDPVACTREYRYDHEGRG